MGKKSKAKKKRIILAIALALGCNFSCGFAAEGAYNFIKMDSEDVKMDNYNGGYVFLYKHEQKNPGNIIGGNVIVRSAVKNPDGSKAGIVLRTDSDCIDFKNDQQISDVLNNLAKKLSYSLYGVKVDGKFNKHREDNLNGRVEIAEGLTASGLVMAGGNVKLSVLNGAGSLGGGVSKATVFNTVITGDTEKDSEYKENIVFNPNAENDYAKTRYDLGGMPFVIPSIEDNSVNVYAAIKPIDDKSFTVKADKLILDLSRIIAPNDKIYGIYNEDNSYLRLQTNSLSIKTGNNIIGGIYAGTSKGRSCVDISGAVDISGSGEDFTGIKAGKGGEIKINGGLELLAENGGNAIVAENGGSVTVNKATAIKGDVVTKDSESAISLVVSTKSNEDAAWEGDAVGNVDVKLVDGAIWKGEFLSSGNLYLQGGSWWENTGDKNLTFEKFKGTSGMEMPGAITSTGDLTFDNYSGNSIISFKHIENNPSEIIGGNVTVKKADSGSVITMRTDSSGIDINDVAQTKLVFNKLAAKLFYTNYANEERNLDGYAEIAEGLTGSSMSQKLAKIVFDSRTGQGSVADSGKFVYAGCITGDAANDKDYVKRGILSVEGDKAIYDFKEDAIIKNYIDANKVSAGNVVTVNPGKNKEIVLNLNGNDLTIEQTVFMDTMKQVTSSIIYATEEGSKIVINNPGKINLSARTAAYYGGAIDTKGGGCIVINNAPSWENAVTITGVMGQDGVGDGSVFNINWTGIKTFDGSVDIKGLADIYSYGAWSLSTVSDKAPIRIGGGRIISERYTSVDAYGGGSIFLNCEGTGADLRIGSNDLMVGGNIQSTGQWTGAGSAGTINAAFTNDKSFFDGAISSAVGEVNLALQNGAIWTNKDGGFKYGSDDKTNSALRSNVNWFYGGVNERNKGVVVQKQDGDITLRNYKGNTVFVFDRDSNNPFEFVGGDVIIVHAYKNENGNACAIMSTDSSGLDLNDEKQVENILNSLAGKLFYGSYAGGERNLTARAEIAEGLTSSSVKKQADIIFDEHTGQGKTDTTFVINPQTLFATSIVENPELASEYIKAGTVRNGNYTFDKSTVVKLTGESSAAGDTFGFTLCKKFAKAAVQVYGSTDNGAEIIVNAKDELKVDTNVIGGAGIFTGNGTHLTFNGNLVVEGDGADKNTAGIVNHTETNSAKAITDINGNVAIKIKNTDRTFYDEKNPHRRENAIGILNEGGNNGGEINVNGIVDIEVDGTGVMASDWFSDKAVINIMGGKVMSNTSEEKYQEHSLAAYKGIINLGLQKDETGMFEANAQTVELEGNILSIKNIETANEIDRLNGVINLALASGESYWKGLADNAGVDKLGTFNLYLKDGALWLHKKQGATYSDEGKTSNGLSSSSKNLAGEFDGISHVTNLTGGADKAHMGIIAQGDIPIAVDNYSGDTMVIYEHNSEQPSQIIGGDVSIKNAAADSGITLMTDRDGIDLDSEDDVKNVLNALAAKLTYTGAVDGAENNLAGRLVIGEGLTAPGVEYKVGDIAFSAENGAGSLLEGSVANSVNNPIYQGQYETLIMSGTKSAMASAALLWRSGLSDLDKRLGDLRLAGAEKGIWANIYGGKSKLNHDNTEYSTSYKAYQLGYDADMGGGWKTGAAVSYTDGDAGYVLGGSGDLKNTALSLYGTWQGKQGHYADIVLKGGQVENDFKVFNEMSHKVDGNYKTNGYSVSAEYGRRIESSNGFYVEPQAQLIWGRLRSKDYSAASDMKDGAGNCRKLDVNQDGFESLIGRLGVGVGKTNNDSSVYFKASVAHEFEGDFDSSFAAEETKSAGVDLGGTWAILQLGGTVKTSPNSYLYGNIEKSIGGDAVDDWRADLGMRWTF